MVIFIRNKDKMLKYEVLIDKELLSKLKYEIIEKCSIITHKDYQDTYLPKMYGIDDYLKYRNYSEVKIGVREYNDFYSMPEDLYRIKYDEYKFPYLVELLDKLLEDKIEVLKEIYNVNNKKEIISFDEKINRQKELIESINDSEYDKKISELEKLKDLIEQKELNKNQVNVIKYYNKVKKLISYNLIDSITYEEVKRVSNFYNSKVFVKQMDEIKKYIKTNRR